MTDVICDDGLRGFLSYLATERNASAHTCSSYALLIVKTLRWHVGKHYRLQGTDIYTYFKGCCYAEQIYRTYFLIGFKTATWVIQYNISEFPLAFKLVVCLSSHFLTMKPIDFIHRIQNGKIVVIRIINLFFS